MELHNQLGKTAKPHPQNERTGTFPLDNFWTIPALMETQQGYEAPPRVQKWKPDPYCRIRELMQWRTLENISVVCLFRVVDLAPPPQKNKWGWEGLTPKHHHPPFRACACCGTVCAVIYEVDNTKTRSEPKVWTAPGQYTCVASVPE